VVVLPLLLPNLTPFPLQPGAAMPFRRYVAVGRVAYVNLAADPLFGKLVVIVDIIDQNRVRPGSRPAELARRRSTLA